MTFTEQAPFSTNSAVERTILYGLLCYTPGFRRAYNKLVTYKRSCWNSFRTKQDYHWNVTDGFCCDFSVHINLGEFMASMVDLGSWILDFGFRILDFGFCFSERFGFCIRLLLLHADSGRRICVYMYVSVSLVMCG